MPERRRTAAPAPRLLRDVVAALALALAAACAHPLAHDSTVCPEYHDLRCATAPECSMDQRRGCRACWCGSSAADGSGKLPSAIPPDRRTPQP